MKTLHDRRGAQLLLGLLMGIAFGFLLHRGGVTKYEVLIGQLLLEDFTVVKVMLSAVIVGMVGVQVLRDLGLATLHPKSGSPGATITGGLIFGVAFGLLGYCPGTALGAAAHGTLDAFAGLIGMLLGIGLFASLYTRLASILNRRSFGEITLPELLRTSPWAFIIPFAALLVGLLYWLETL